MKRLLAIILLMQTTSIRADAFSFKNGDLILESIPCYLCSLIEAEENSNFSHLGILVFDQGNWMVMEAWNQVRLTTLEEFVSRKRKSTSAIILRSNQFINETEIDSKTLLQRFEKQFKNLNYDSEFSWFNQDEKGEKLYCSEFVLKLMNHFLMMPIAPKAMHFNVNRELWIQYFKGSPPDGQLGISPGDFEHSTLFQKVGAF